MKKVLTLGIMTLLFAAWNSAAFASEVVVYSAHKEHLIKPLFDAYTAETGVKVKYITAKAGALLERIKAEGDRTSADMFMTVDAGNLWHAANEGVLQPVSSEVLEKKHSRPLA
ncbi:extracellular solute-binding protein [Oleidesulfovibrio sp.]|uniref:extracellular solute-binding protein n=1 Tax=Oleidesulfovibrio sp. TaxID=2909707 RepID=UPI003A879BD5